MSKNRFTIQERLEFATRDGFSAAVIEFINKHNDGKGTETLVIKDEDGKRHTWKDLTPEVVGELDRVLTELGIAEKPIYRRGK